MFHMNGMTDGKTHDEANGRFLKLCVRDKKFYFLNTNVNSCKKNVFSTIQKEGPILSQCSIIYLVFITKNTCLLCGKK